MTYYVSSVLFFFNDTSTTEIYTYYTLFPYATLFRSHAADLLGRGEARVMASDSEPMPAAASEAFDKAIALDAKDPRARYFLAVRKDIGGDHQGAIADWFALLSDTTRGAPWEADLRRTIEQVGANNKIEAAGRAAPPRPRPQRAPATPAAA